MLRKLNYAIIAALVALFIAGRAMRAARMNRGPVAGGKTEVRLGVAGWQETEFPFKEMIEKFEARHPEIDVTLHQLPADYEMSLMLRWKAGEPVYDLILAPESGNYVRFYEAGVIAPLDEYITEEFKSDFVGAFTADTIFDGKTYALGFMGEVQTLNYRSDLLSQVGVKKAPATWPEVESAMKLIAAKGFTSEAGNKVYPITLNMMKGFFVPNTYIPMWRSYRKGKITGDDGHLDLASPEAHRVFDDIRRWYRAGWVSPNGINTYGAPEDFKVGIAAFYPHWQSRGLWAVETLGADRIGIVGSPASSRVGSLIATHGGIIPRCSPVPREAALLLTEGICTEMQPGVAKAGKMPVIKSAYEDKAVPGWMRDLLPSLADGYTTPDPLVGVRVHELVAIQFHEFLADDSVTAADALRKAREQVQRVYDGQ